MRIGIDLRSLQAGSQYRGIGYYTYNLVKALCKIDRDNEYIFFANQCGASDKYPLLDTLINETGKRLVSLPITRVEERKWKRQWETISSPTFFNIEKVDILHVTSLFESEIPVGFPPIRGKLIITIYDLIPLVFRELYLDKASPEWQSEYMESLNLVKKNADGIVAISECTKHDTIRLLDYPAEKIDVVYGGVSNAFYVVKDANLLKTVKERFGIIEKFILFTAAEDPRKNFETLIKAFAILPKEYNNNYQLVIAGRSSRQWQDQLQDLGASLGINEGKLISAGFVTDEELNLLYNAAALFVFPSLYEGFGLPILEAMSCGVPVIAANNSSIPEVCGDAAIMVDPMNKIEMAQSMNNVLSKHTLQQELREKGFQNIKRFSWEMAAETTIRFYERIANVS